MRTMSASALITFLTWRTRALHGNCLEGGLDEKLKKSTTTHYIESPASGCVKDLLLDPKQSFGIASTVVGEWLGIEGPYVSGSGRLVSAGDPLFMGGDD